MIKRLLALALIVLPAHAAPVLVESGDLEVLLATNSTPESGTDVYQLPTDAERAAFRLALQHVLDGDLQAAADEAVAANYEVVSYEDNVSGDTFALLREQQNNRKWGGLYAVDTSPERTLVVECPHPIYDGVRVPAADLFLETSAVAYLLAGTHRNNASTPSNCDGTLEGEPYRISDIAHSPESLFQAAHEVIEAHFARTVSLSFHGMAEDTDPADIVVSNGTGLQCIGNSLSRALATRMNEILADAMDSRTAVSHQEPGENPALSGSTNTQGRATNGSPEPCTAEAPMAVFPERFIHMECDPDVSDGDPANWAVVIQALTELVPLFSDPVADTPEGDLVITEAMINPAQVGDATGEYLEFFNHTGAAITMTDWTLVDRQLNRATFSGEVGPGDLFVVGGSGDLNGGADGGAPDAVWTDVGGEDFTLTNTGDAISLLDADGNLVASFAYDDGDPFGSGVALEVAVGNAHPDGQTRQADYLAATSAFAADFGSPGTRGDSAYPLAPTRVAPQLDPGTQDFSLAFTTTPAVTYTLLRSPDLTAWPPFAGIDPVVGDGEDTAITFPLPDPASEFYQLHYRYLAPEWISYVYTSR